MACVAEGVLKGALSRSLNWLHLFLTRVSHLAILISRSMDGVTAWHVFLEANLLFLDKR